MNQQTITRDAKCLSTGNQKRFESMAYREEEYWCLTVRFNPIRPGLFSRSPAGGGLRGPDAKNQG